MIEFKELKQIIQRICKTNQTTEIYDRFSFSIDTEKLEEMLNEKSDLHVMGFAKELNSRIPTYNDLQLIEEYMPKNKKGELSDVFDGNSQIITLSFYCTEDGSLKIENDGEIVSGEALYNMINGSSDQLNKDIILSIIENFPIYRSLIVKHFNSRKDKFEYIIYFRSNYIMINYIKDLKNSGDFKLEEK